MRPLRRPCCRGRCCGEIARLEGERRSLLSEIGRLEQSANNAEVERVRISKSREPGCRGRSCCTSARG